MKIIAGIAQSDQIELLNRAVLTYMLLG